MTERRRNVEVMPSRGAQNRRVPKPSSRINPSSHNEESSAAVRRTVNVTAKKERPIRENSKPTRRQAPVNNVRQSTVTKRTNTKIENEKMENPINRQRQIKIVLYPLIKDEGIDFTKVDEDYYVESVLEHLQDDTPPVTHHINFPAKLYSILENLVITVNQIAEGKETVPVRTTERRKKIYE